MRKVKASVSVGVPLENAKALENVKGGSAVVEDDLMFKNQKDGEFIIIEDEIVLRGTP